MTVQTWILNCMGTSGSSKSTPLPELLVRVKKFGCPTPPLRIFTKSKASFNLLTMLTCFSWMCFMLADMLWLTSACNDCDVHMCNVRHVRTHRDHRTRYMKCMNAHASRPLRASWSSRSLCAAFCLNFPHMFVYASSRISACEHCEHCEPCVGWFLAWLQAPARYPEPLLELCSEADHEFGGSSDTSRCD